MAQRLKHRQGVHAHRRREDQEGPQQDAGLAWPDLQQSGEAIARSLPTSNIYDQVPSYDCDADRLLLRLLTR